jgi:hypothetical protein
MKYSVLLSAILFAAAAACHSRQSTIYADTEGPRIGEQPPLIRPARSVNPQLRAQSRASLVVRTRFGFEPGSASVTLNAGWPGAPRFQRISTSDGVAEFADLEPGEYTATIRHVGLRPQQLRLVVAAGFSDTLLFSLGQP